MMSHIIHKQMKKDESGFLMLGRVGIDPRNSMSNFRGYIPVNRKKIRADIINVEIQMVTEVRAEKLLQNPGMSHHEHGEILPPTIVPLGSFIHDSLNANSLFNCLRIFETSASKPGIEETRIKAALESIVETEQMPSYPSRMNCKRAISSFFNRRILVMIALFLFYH